MYLAMKEMKKEKLRFLMIILVTALIAYLVYFLSSLAYGLAQINRTAIDHWNAEGIVITKPANGNIYGSMINETDLNDLRLDLNNAITINTATTYVANESDPYSLVFLGYDLNNDQLTPKIIDGREIEDNDEIIVSHNIKKDVEVDLGDWIKLSSSNKSFKIVGFTQDSNYNTVPVVYGDRVSVASALRDSTPEGSDADAVQSNQPLRYSGWIAYDPIDQDSLDDYELVYMDIDSFIKELPGYQAQVLTFSLMIVSLAAISSIIIGIFMYILTMQKKSIFGVLKIQGYRNLFIMKSVIYQAVVVTSLGFILGFMATLLTVEFLPPQVPTALFWELYLLITLFAIICSLIGSLFSARSILKIDPLDAL